MVATITPSTEDNEASQIVLKRMSENHIRIATLGNVDAGKSTLTGTLISGKLDDGRGSARAAITKHKHELITGRTSTIGTHLLGLDDNAKPITSHNNQSDLVLKSNRLVTLMDLAGHEKYLKTTIAGIARGMADYALVLVNAMQPPTHMTMHHLKLCVTLGIPAIVVMTKCDRCPSHVFRSTKQEIQAMIRGPELGLKPFAVKSKQDIGTVQTKVACMLLTPIIPVSCVTGEGIENLQELLSVLPQRRKHAKKQRNKDFEFLVEDIYQVPGVGTVLSGFVSRGEWKKGETLYFGPLKDGSVLETVPKSVHVSQTNVNSVWAGHTVCFAIPKPPRGKRIFLGKGMVATKKPLQLTHHFVAEMFLVKGKNVTIHRDKFEGTLHILNNKLAAVVKDIADTDGVSMDVARQGERVVVTFRFTRGPTYVRPGMRIILRDGHVLGYGVVVANPISGTSTGGK